MLAPRGTLFSCDVFLILRLMIRTGLSFGKVQDKLKEIDMELSKLRIIEVPSC